ncbi:THO complex subunit 1, partial [Galemys pyrenaicus]
LAPWLAAALARAAISLLPGLTSSGSAAARWRARATEKMSPTPPLFSLPEARTRFTSSSTFPRTGFRTPSTWYPGFLRRGLTRQASCGSSSSAVLASRGRRLLNWLEPALAPPPKRPGGGTFCRFTTPVTPAPSCEIDEEVLREKRQRSAWDGLQKSTREALNNKNIKPLLSTFGQLPGSENEKKCTLDQAFRGVLEEEIINHSSCENVLAIISLAIGGVTEDLLRRLSKSQNTVFCGRIQLFLARLFPLSEKSGLNLQSQFNLENVTVFNTNEQESTLGQKHTEDREEGMDVEEGEMGDDEAPTTWNPVQCYEKISWKTFLKYSEEVLAVFKSYKLDDTQASRKKMEELKTGGEHVYFAKFLTSEKLMDLQLSDSNFRRHILLQYLILFQYLKGQVKFKSSNYVLTDEQSLWIEDTTKSVYQLLSENPPDGERFSKMVEHILNTEENWNSWKNEGCPSFVKERTSDTKPTRIVRKRTAPEDFLGKGPNKKILMGNDELTRLWNLCPDNMEACKSETRMHIILISYFVMPREYMPTLEDFFEEAIEQADPENMVENEYKAVNNSNYGWRALRLLARRSPHFFQPTNQQFKSLPEYLENMVIKLAKELPPPSEEIKTGEDEDEEDNDALLKENESPDVRRDKPVTGEQIEVFANKLGEQWKILAPYLEMKDSEIRQIECDSEDMKMRAKQLLVAWQDQEGVHATPENLINALNKSGLSDLAESLTNDNETNS